MRLLVAAALVCSAVAGAAVKTGVEVLIEGGYAQLAGMQRIGIVTNPTGILPSLQHEVDYLVADPRISSKVVAVFGPEHGFRGAAQDGQGGESYNDTQTGLPVYTTYGKNASAIAALLDSVGVDAVVFDIQDVGVRFYTYIWTLFDVMHAAALSGRVRAIVVLDRPNPIGGLKWHGPMLRPEFSSFVGRVSIPLRHGMTVCELASLFQNVLLPPLLPGGKLPAPLVTVPMQGWSRDMWFDATGLPWVGPSPNMPSLDTASVYPGACLWEGTNASTGRGTTRPFETLGAGFFDWRFAAALRKAQGEWWMQGMAARETFYIPTFDRFVGTTCAGVQLYVTDRAAADPFATSLGMLAAALEMYPDNMRITTWMDQLTGSNTTRLALTQAGGADLRALLQRLYDEGAGFAQTRQQFLIY